MTIYQMKVIKNRIEKKLRLYNKMNKNKNRIKLRNKNKVYQYY